MIILFQFITKIFIVKNIISHSFISKIVYKCFSAFTAYFMKHFNHIFLIWLTILFHTVILLSVFIYNLHVLSLSWRVGIDLSIRVNFKDSFLNTISTFTESSSCSTILDSEFWTFIWLRYVLNLICSTTHLKIKLLDNKNKTYINLS